MRKFYLISSALISLALLAATARADQAGAEKQIKDMTEQFGAAWNKNDAKAVADFWADDGDLIDPAGVEAKGKAAVERFFTDRFAGDMKGSTNKLSVTNVRLLGDAIAVVDWDATMTSMARPDDDGLTKEWKHHVILVLNKEGDTWKIVAARPYTFMKPEGPGPAPALPK